MSSPSAFQRARRPEQKQQRREAILDTARALGLRDGVRNVSLADIAGEIGIHKSALLRYFETREQIFLELTARAWTEWAQSVQAEIGAVPRGATHAVAAALARSFAERPLLCDLIPHTALNHERNVSVETVRRYKLTSLGAIQNVAEATHKVLPRLTIDECRELVATMANAAGSLWQISNPPPALADLYASDPQLGHAVVDLYPRLQRTAEVLLAGFIPARRRSR